VLVVAVEEEEEVRAAFQLIFEEPAQAGHSWYRTLFPLLDTILQ
jgi:hypothetical protein